MGMRDSDPGNEMWIATMGNSLAPVLERCVLGRDGASPHQCAPYNERVRPIIQQSYHPLIQAWRLFPVLPLINTQLQLGAKPPILHSNCFNRFTPLRLPCTSAVLFIHPSINP